MNRGQVTAKQALKNPTQDAIIHDEIYSIEKSIREAATLGFRSVIIDNTLITSNLLNSEVQIQNIDLTTNVFTIGSHGFQSGDYVVVRQNDTLPVPLITDTEYVVDVIDTNTFRLKTSSRYNQTIIDITDIGVGLHYIRKLIPAEQFFKAWDKFYIYEDAEQKLYIINTIETHVKSMGYDIKKFKDNSTNTFYWQIIW